MYLIAVDTSISMFDESFWTFTSMRTNGINAKILALVIFRPRKNIICSSDKQRDLKPQTLNIDSKLTGIRQYPYRCHFL